MTKDKMPAKWTGEVVKKMHNNRITNAQLAVEMHCTKSYISMILNGARNPDGGRERIEKAVDDIIARRKI